MEEKFGGMVTSLKTYKTQGTSNQSIIEGSNGGKLISVEKLKVD